MDDEYALERFVDAQNQHGTYQAALRELRTGRKRGHWMWFVFPQVAGLGSSFMSQRYAISGLPEAQAYLAHPVLGVRIREYAAVLLDLPTPDAVAVLGGIDAKKLHSSMTLFAAAAPHEPLFAKVLDTFFGGASDAGTTSRLSR